MQIFENTAFLAYLLSTFLIYFPYAQSLFMPYACLVFMPEMRKKFHTVLSSLWCMEIFNNANQVHPDNTLPPNLGTQRNLRSQAVSNIPTND